MTEGSGAAQRLVGRYCGHRFGWTLVSNSSELTLALSGVGDWEIGTHRFTVQYEATSEYCTCQVFLTCCGGRQIASFLQGL